MLLVLKRFVRVCLINRCYYSADKGPKMKYLCVAEKNDAAKNIAGILSKGSSTRREGFSPFNKIYEFDCAINGQDSTLIMTSVSGHLLNYAFPATFKPWKSCNPVDLFEAPVHKVCPEDYVKVKRTLEREIRYCQGLIIWTDCDREGENIGFEIIQVCRDVKANLKILRAKFSEITSRSIWRAVAHLEQPNKDISDAVDVRMEVDLRTGAAFTRLQTLRLQKVFPRSLEQKLISYGSCQFPTLGFVVERFKAIENFIPERFWHINLSHRTPRLTTEFSWKRNRLFDKNPVVALLDMCLQANNVTIESVESKPKSKWRPLPLDTVEMEKIISRKMKINAKEVMKIAEKLYTQGYISYPRTETNIFPKEMNLQAIVEQQRGDSEWGHFAQRVLVDGPNPRQGKKSDQAHPPIHPTKYTNGLSGNEKKIYEYIVRHFLACVSKDAKGQETIVNADCAGEKFVAKGLVVLERNYLDVYIYETWNGKEINHYNIGDTFIPTTLELGEGITSPPKLLTEADLIALMEKHGIGTDATHAEHIETIKSREYVTLQQNMYFIPAALGMGLVEGYNNMELQISLAKPNLRSDFEIDLKLICEGQKQAEAVLREQIAKYREVFLIVAEKMAAIDDTLAQRLNDAPEQYTEEVRAVNKSVMKCPKCGHPMYLRERNNAAGWFLGCSNYPECRNAGWMAGASSVQVTDDTCPQCGPDVRKVKITFRQNPFFGEPNPNVMCLGGCDAAVLSALDIPKAVVRMPSQTNQVPSQSSSSSITTTQDFGSFRNNTTSTRPTPNSNRSQNNTKKNTKTPSNQGTINSWVNNNNSSSASSSRITTYASNSDEVLCNCSKPAVLLRCQRGPNSGRQFYKCPDRQPKSEDGCGFFAWKDDEQPTTSSPAPPPSPPPRAPPGRRGGSRQSDSNTEETKCGCGLAVIERTVVKEGPNKGRKFYTCPQPYDQQCKYFEWNDEDDTRSSSHNNSRTVIVRRPYKKRKEPKDNNSTSTKRAKRKCGICHEEGHTRTHCPRNDMS